MFFIHNSPADAELLARAVVSACCPGGMSLTPVQRRWLDVVFGRLLGYVADFDHLDHVHPITVRSHLGDARQRLELLELMVSLEMLCNPIPVPLRQSVEHWAEVLAVETEALIVVRELAAHHQQRATSAWYRLSWFGRDAMPVKGQARLLQEHGIMSVALTFEPDPEEALRWRALKQCSSGSLGHAMFNLLNQELHAFPGEPGGTNPILARHDWIHLITNLPISPIGEIATAAYIASAVRTSSATLAFLGTISIFEASLLEYDTALSEPDCPAELPRFRGALDQPGAMEWVACAAEAGQRCPIDPLHDVNYFDWAERPLKVIRQEWQLSEHGLLPPVQLRSDPSSA